MIKKILPISFFLIYLFSCSKEDECNSSRHEKVILDECLYGYMFNIGSNWTYEDTLTKQTNITTLDSVNPLDWDSKSGSGNCASTASGIDYKFYYSDSLFGNFFHAYRASAVTFNDNTYYFLCETDVDSIVIAGVTYYDVTEISTNNTQLYFKDSVGLIRRIDTNNVVYDLVSYNVSFFTP